MELSALAQWSSGIARTFAQTDGYDVVLTDIKQEWADGGKAKIKKGLDRMVSKGTYDPGKEMKSSARSLPVLKKT